MVDLEKIDVRLAVTDTPVGRLPERMNCPQHKDTVASLRVYPDGLYCFGCGFRLATLSGLAFLLYGRWDKLAMGKAAGVSHKYTAQALDAYRERVNQSVNTDPLPDGIAVAYRNLLNSTRLPRKQWLFDRGLTSETIQRFDLGHDGTRFTLPIYSAAGRLLTIRFRRDDAYGVSYFDERRGEEIALPKYSGMQGRNGLYVFPEFDLAQAVTFDSVETLVVVEGELDAIRLWQEGVPAISTTNGAGNVKRLPDLVREKFPTIKALIFSTDQDEPGQAAAAQGANEADKLGLGCAFATWPQEQGKDITEFLMQHTLDEVTLHGDTVRFPHVGD